MMNDMRSLLRALFVIVLTAVALPSAAAPSTKFFYAEFPATVPAGTTTLDVTFHNATPPPGVSTINTAVIVIESPTPAPFTILSAQMISPVDPTVTVTPAGDGKTYTLSDFTGIKNNKSGTFRLTLSGSPSSCTSVTFSAYANTGNAVPPNGDNFVPTRTDLLTTGVGCDGVLACESDGSGFTFGDLTAGGKRVDNKDGSACIKVVYDFTNDIANNNTVSLVWDKNLQPYAAFSYSATWNPEFVSPTTGLPTKITYVAWDLLPDGISPKYTAGRACTSSSPPSIYGTLNGGINDSQTTIFVTTSATVPTPPFAIIVQSTAPNKPERMTVTAIAGNQWTVDRGQGGTVAVPHAADAKVNSTPMPIIYDDPDYPEYNGKQAQVCIWDEGWVSDGVAACPTDPTRLCAKVLRSTSVFDNGDGWVSSR